MGSLALDEKYSEAIFNLILVQSALILENAALDNKSLALSRQLAVLDASLLELKNSSLGANPNSKLLIADLTNCDRNL